MSNPTTTIHVGDALEVLRGIPDASIDAVVTDPPYGLNFMGKDWDHAVPSVEYWAEALRVAKPGAHLLAFGGTRLYHRLTCAIEDAGWEIRDCLMWVYGEGFPKSLDVSKAIDSRKDWQALEALQGNIKAARTKLGISQSEAARRMGLIGPTESLGGGGYMWFETGQRIPTREQYESLKRALEIGDECDAAFESAEREVIGRHSGDMGGFSGVRLGGFQGEITTPATDAAKKWNGYGTALKPAVEPVILARKPLDGTVAQNIQKHGVGALNIDGCRVGLNGEENPSTARRKSKPPVNNVWEDKRSPESYAADRPSEALGRWPANLIHDGSEEVLEVFPQQSGGGQPKRRGAQDSNAYGVFNGHEAGPGVGPSSGSAARLFYCPKASSADRGNETLRALPLFGVPEVRNTHPTVKPTTLMSYLCRLVTPPGGLILDMFCGSGSTGVAAVDEGFRFVGIELNEEYAEIARRRIDAATGTVEMETKE